MSNYTPRFTAPDTSNMYYYSGNIFHTSGWGLPNCTCYAWGRFYEVTGVKPLLCTYDAERWWNFNDGYSRGNTPKLGAIAVWAKGSVSDDSDGVGHVAVVEEIIGDTITTSNSYYGGNYFALETLRKPYNRSGQTFLGFIYCPISANKWVAKNAYLNETEKQTNAKIVKDFLTDAGWSENAIFALLGNMDAESTINPAIWESLTKEPNDFYNTHGYMPGYGLVQWTPYTKYTEWAGSGWETDYDKQLKRILWELENGQQYYPTNEYPETFREFTTSTKSVEYLAAVFLYNYERPASPNPSHRAELSNKWKNYFKKTVIHKPRPLWLLFKFNKRS